MIYDIVVGKMHLFPTTQPMKCSFIVRKKLPSCRCVSSARWYICMENSKEREMCPIRAHLQYYMPLRTFSIDNIL